MWYNIYMVDVFIINITPPEQVTRPRDLLISLCRNSEPTQKTAPTELVSVILEHILGVELVAAIDAYEHLFLFLASAAPCAPSAVNTCRITHPLFTSLIDIIFLSLRSPLRSDLKGYNTK
jgi:hypothetical protein